MHANMKLGRVRPTSKQRALAPRLKDFLTAPLPPPPDDFHGHAGAAIGMFGNDRYGDCTIAGAANYRAIRAKLDGEPAPPTSEDAVVKQYLALSPNDDGLVEIDVLQRSKSTGLELGGPTWMSAVWATVGGYDEKTFKSLIAIFGALYLGVELPLDAQNQDVWHATTGRGGAPGGWGGHCLLASGWTKGGPYELITWGGVKGATEDWLVEYEDEIHVIVDADSAAVANVDFEKMVTYASEVDAQ